MKPTKNKVVSGADEGNVKDGQSGHRNSHRDCVASDDEIASHTSSDDDVEDDVSVDDDVVEAEEISASETNKENQRLAFVGNESCGGRSGNESGVGASTDKLLMEKEKEKSEIEILREQNKMLQSKLTEAKAYIERKKFGNVEGDFVNKELTNMQIGALTKFVKSSIYPVAKYVDEGMLEAKPQLLDSCYKHLSIVQFSDKQLIRKSLISRMTYALVQHRRYHKTRLKPVYKGKYLANHSTCFPLNVPGLTTYFLRNA